MTHGLFFKTVCGLALGSAGLAASPALAQKYYARQVLHGLTKNASSATPTSKPAGYARCGPMELAAVGSKNHSVGDVYLVATNDSLDSPAEALAWCQAQKLPEGQVGWGCRYFPFGKLTELRSAGPVAAAAGTERYENPNVYSAVCQ